MSFSALIKHCFLVSFILIIFLTLVRLPVFADGMIMYNHDPYANRWDFADETDQQAFINYKDGVEYLLVAIGSEIPETSGAVWVFPVPSDPQNVKLDVVTAMPQLNGEELRIKAESRLSGLQNAVLFTQLYPIPFMFIKDRVIGSYSSFGGDVKSGLNYALNAPSGSSISDVEVYDRIEKAGMVSEVVTAQTSEGIYRYLNQKGLPVTADSIVALTPYIGRKYSFILSWIPPEVTIQVPTDDEIEYKLSQYFFSPGRFPITDAWMRSIYARYPELQEAGSDARNSLIIPGQTRLNYLKTSPAISLIVYNEFKNNLSVLKELNYVVQGDHSLSTLYPPNPVTDKSSKRGVLVSFPTTMLYFPLIPTSVYADKIVPLTLRVLGHITPLLYPEIESGSSVKYYTEESHSFSPELAGFYGESNIPEIKNFDYTKIFVNVPSNRLVQDLWIVPKKPLSIILPKMILNYPVIFFLVFMILVSGISSVLAGVVVFAELRSLKGIAVLVRMGMSNLLTLLGFVIAVIFWRTKTGEIDPALKEEYKILKQKYQMKRRLGVILIACLVTLLPVFLFASMLVEIYLYRFVNFLNYIPMTPFTTGIFLIIVFGPGFIAWFLLVKFVRKFFDLRSEDQDLADRIHQSGFSTDTFLPNDYRKLVFVILFTILFVIFTIAGFLGIKDLL